MAGKLEDRVKEIIVDQLGVNAEQVTPEASFIDDLGADSLDSVDLFQGIRRQRPGVTATILECKGEKEAAQSAQVSFLCYNRHLLEMMLATA